MRSGLDVHFLGCLDFNEVRVFQQELVDRVLHGDGQESLICCEHLPVLSFGKSQAIDEKLCSKLGIRGVNTDRGGLLTYHCPGQLVLYPVVDLRSRGYGLKKFVELVLRELATVSKEVVLTESKSEWGESQWSEIECYPRMDCVGVWTRSDKCESKVGFAGLRIQNGITNHGFSLNVNCNTEIFREFTPCGMSDVQITSLQELSGQKRIDFSGFTHEVAARINKAFALI